MTTTLIAMDRAPSGRRIDADGHLHVETSNMTKAGVNPYYGNEIPGYQALGLDPARLYRMYRPADQIARGIDTLNGKPILFNHKPTTANDHAHDLTVGCTGTNAAFDGTYGTNTLTLWTRPAIYGVESKTKHQLSAGYRYRPVMTPGEYQGLPYDGEMHDIEFQHVALVVTGRAGADVIVGDEAMKLNSRTALMLSGAITSHVVPKLADGAKVDISSALKDVDAKSFAMDGAPKALADQIATLVTPHLAADQTVDGLADILATVTPIAMDEDRIEVIPVTPPVTPPPAVTPEPKGDPAPVTPPVEDKPAMDADTVTRMIENAVAATKAEGVAISTAQSAVRPIVGELVGMDSAAAIYKVALDHMKVDVTGVPESGFKPLFDAMAKVKAPVIVAQDAAPDASVMGDIDKQLANLGKAY